MFRRQNRSQLTLVVRWYQVIFCRRSISDPWKKISPVIGYPVVKISKMDPVWQFNSSCCCCSRCGRGCVWLLSVWVWMWMGVCTCLFSACVCLFVVLACMCMSVCLCVCVSSMLQLECSQRCCWIRLSLRSAVTAVDHLFLVIFYLVNFDIKRQSHLAKAFFQTQPLMRPGDETGHVPLMCQFIYGN